MEKTRRLQLISILSGPASEHEMFAISSLSADTSSVDPSLQLPYHSLQWQLVGSDIVPAVTQRDRSTEDVYADKDKIAIISCSLASLLRCTDKLLSPSLFHGSVDSSI